MVATLQARSHQAIKGVVNTLWRQFGPLLDLKSLEATEVLAQIERVCNLFADGVPTDLEARNEAINSWPDGDDAIEALLQDVDEALMPLMKDLERVLHEHLHRNYPSLLR
jgi:hypothetical protein